LQVRLANSLVPLATLEGLLTRASSLSCTAISPGHLARASCNLVGSANLWKFTFLHRNFAEPPPSCLLQPCRVCSPVRVYFTTQQDRRATSLVPLATLAGPLTRVTLLSCTASSPSHLARAFCNLARSANPCEFTFQHRMFAEPPRSCLLQPWKQVRRATSLVPFATLPGLLTRASLLSCTASSPSHLARAFCNLARSANPCEFTFLHSKFAEPPRSCLLQPCQQVRRATSLVPFATLPGLLTRASLLSCTASSPSHLARAFCNLARSANPCEFTFLHSKFAEPPRSCLLQPCQQVRRATSLVPFATLPGLLTRASLLSCTASSPSHLARAFCNLARSANPCEFTFLHSKFAEPPRSCLLQPCQQVRRATSLVPFATLPGLLTRASLLSCTASSPSHLARAFCNLARSANPCEFTFLHSKFAEPPRSCLLQPCQQVRRATSLVPFATLPGLLTRASLLSCTASSPSHLARAFCNLARSANPCEFTFLHSKFAEPPRSCLLQPCQQVRRATSLVPFATLPGLLTRASLLSCTASSPSHLARAFCNLARSANPCEFTFLHSKFAEPPRSCLLQPCQQVRRATSLVPFATLPGLLTRASLLSCTASSPSHLARAFCNLARSANPCEFTFLHSKFAEPPRSCLLQPCQQVRRATLLVPLATLPGLLARASLLSSTACSPSHLARASCNLGGSANPCEFTFLHRNFAEPPRSCLLQTCQVCLPVRVYFPAPQLRRATSLVPLANLPGLLTRASLLSCTATSPSHLARASCKLARSAYPCEFTFLHRNFAEPPRSCLLQTCQVCLPVRVYFPAPQLRRATSLVPLANLPGLLTRASLLSCTATSPSHLARASCKLARSAYPCEFTFLHRNFAEPPRSCLLQTCQVCLPVRVYFPAPQLRRATSLVPLANLPGLLTRASLLSCTATSPSHLARASCKLARSAYPCEFTFLHRNFAEPPRSCLLQTCQVCLPVRVYFPAPQLRRATSLVPLANLPGLLTRASLLSCTATSPSHLARASCKLARSAYPCEFTFLHRNFAEPPRSCLLQTCQVCLPVRVYFPAPQLRRATSLVPLANLPGLLTRASLLSCTATSPSHLARASCKLARSAYPCEFTFLHRNFAEPPRSCLLQTCQVCLPVRVYFPAPQLRRATSLVPLATLAGPLTRVCLPVRVYFPAQQVRRATSLVPLATLAGPLTRGSLLSCTASSPSHLARASCNLGGSANPWEFTFLHSKFAEPPRSCLLQTRRGLLTRASLLSCTASSPSHLAHASSNLVGCGNPWEFTFRHRKFTEPPRSCLLQPCRQVRRATLLVPLATLAGPLTRVSLLSCTASSPSQLARASRNLARSANPCEFTFQHRKFAEPPRSCLLQPCWQVRRATLLVPLATLAGPLTRGSLLSCTASSPSQLARASRNLARSANSCEFTFLHSKFAEPPCSCLLQPWRVR
ncbi:hypothetical protein CRG98_002327, partial [Punica granatum]